MMNPVSMLKTRLGRAVGGLMVAGLMAGAAYAANCSVPPNCQIFTDENGVCQAVVCYFPHSIHLCEEFGCV
ncbi:MAG: hypothetical protein JJU26_12640 [Oceanicaulis sp.]|uniref:hypothetical protein n=1 Tax=Glycocaulis sp. TaxID=1969725 RepID=UPI0025C3A219|nr:hypothetical protein [Glycocaulis sp.]MCC5982551.1 hypothetical protein [Oceanicaulis sp.]MCH8521396.1 hypothetical protein [Glycocaulis sp.]